LSRKRELLYRTGWRDLANRKNGRGARLEIEIATVGEPDVAVRAGRNTRRRAPDVVPVVLIATRTAVDWRILEAVPAVAVLAVNGLWVSILLGMLSARFRDIPPIIGSLLQVGFLLTPVFWPIAALGDWVPLAAFNPIFAAIDVVRAPILGVPTEANSWIVLLGSTTLGWLITYALFVRFRMRIAYWI
jgi:ABC-type polysaccharide/polyol phosphate export permease